MKPALLLAGWLSLATLAWSASEARPSPANTATAPAPGQYATGLAITPAGPGPYLRLALPQALHSLAQDPNLADLRVRNAQGQTQPWAWAPEPRQEQASLQQTLAVFAVPPESTGANSAAKITLKADGSVQWQGTSPAPSKAPAQTWIVDAHQLSGNMLSLSLQWDPAVEGVFPLRIEASDDLRNWYTVSSDAAVLRLRRSGQTLLQDTLALNGLRARYLRLQWLGTPLALQGVQVEHLRSAVAAPPPMQWSDAWLPSSCDERACSWDLPAHLPLDAVKLDLAQSNTVASIRLLGQSPAVQAPHVRSHPLHGLRHRREAQAQQNASQDHVLWEGVVWRLSLPDQSESRQAVLGLDGGQYQRLRLEVRQSPSDWGKQPPSLALGTRSREIMVLAREPGPLSLTWGDAKAPGAAQSVTDLMPLGARSPVSQASVMGPALARPLVQPSADKAAASASNAAASAQSKPWLWAALGAGLLLLAGMAYSLLKSSKSQT